MDQARPKIEIRVAKVVWFDMVSVQISPFLSK